MKRFSKFTSLLLAVLTVLSAVSFGALAEEGTPAPASENYIVNVVADGAGIGSFNCYFNGNLSNESYSGSATALPVEVEAAEGFKIVAAYFESDTTQNLTPSGSKYIGIFYPSAGSVYTLRVVTEATIAVKNTVSVNSNVGFEVYDKNGLKIDDLSVSEFAAGDAVTVKFLVDGTFDPAKATLTNNGVSVSLSSNEYKFNVAGGSNAIVFNYDLSAAPAPANVTVESGSVAYTVTVNGTVVTDLSGIMVGDTVKIDFAVDGFLSANASLTYNGSAVALDAPSFSFTAAATNAVVFSYGAVSAKLSVNSDYSYAVFVNGTETDPSNPVFAVGDTVRIVFNVDGEFDPSKAVLFHNGVKGTLSGTSYTFTAVAVNNNITFKYGDALNATLVVSGHGRDLTNIGYSVILNGTTVDPAAAEFKLGDTVKVVFDVQVADPADAFLSLNNESVAVTDNTYTFTLAYESNVLVFGYGVVPVRFALTGPGYYSIMKTDGEAFVAEVRNTNASGSATKTLYLNKGENYKFTVNPALNYELSGEVAVTEPQRDYFNGFYFIVPSGESRVSAAFKAASTTVTTYQLKINVHIGGNVLMGTQTVLGGTGSQLDLAEGQGVIFTIQPDEGYQLDRFIVGGVEVAVTANSYTLSGITAATTVDVYFKSNQQIDVSDAIGVDDINWNSETVVIDISGNKPIKREVFTKIASLDKNSGKFVEFSGDGVTLFVPYGGVFSGTSDTVSITVSEMRSGTLYSQISTAVSEQDGVGTLFKVYSVSPTENLPQGTKIAFDLGNGFSSSNVALRTYDGFSFADAASALTASPTGISEKYDYNNQPTLICVKVAAEAPDNSGSGEPSGGESVSAGDDSSDSEDNNGGGTVIVIIIIALVAVAGAAALFIVKWRQEKF